MFCHQLIRADCPKKHKLSWECGSGPPQVCAKCEAEKAEQAKRDKRDQELELRRQRKEREYITQMAALEHEFEYKRQLRQDEDLERERQNALRQRRLDLENMDAISQHMHDLRVNAPQSQATSSVENSSQPSTSLAQQPTLKGVNQMPRPQISKASEDWERQKSVLNSKNDAIESLMGMIGLEEVKEKFLSVKAKVETVLRQNTDLKDERFGAVLLGNPGTGKHKLIDTLA